MLILMTIFSVMNMGGMYSRYAACHVTMGPGSQALSSVEGLRLTSFPSAIVSRSLASHIPILSLNIQLQVNSLYSLLDNHTPSKTRTNILSSSRWSWATKRPDAEHREREEEHKCRGVMVSSAKVYLSSLLGYDDH